MPSMMINGCNLFYEEHGTGGQSVVFLHDLFFNHCMFNQQMIALRGRFRCLLIDLRGHGQSDVTSGGFRMETMAHDILQLIDVNRLGKCHLIGAGMGGYLALLCALQRPQLIASLSVIGSSVEASTEQDAKKLKSIALRTKIFGLRVGLLSIMKRSFSHSFMTNPSVAAQKHFWRSEFLKLDRQHIAQAISAYLQRPRLSESLFKIKQPTLLMGGEEDLVTPPASLNVLKNSIVGAKLNMLEDTGHSVNLEKPRLVSQSLLNFLT